jgi:hypothetical protein
VRTSNYLTTKCIVKHTNKKANDNKSISSLQLHCRLILSLSLFVSFDSKSNNSQAVIVVVVVVVVVGVCMFIFNVTPHKNDTHKNNFQ